MMNNKNKSVYIPNLQACDLYDHMFKGKVIKLENHTGMLPYSIELRKLEQEGVKFKKDGNGKRITDKIINVKFSMSVKSAKKDITSLRESLEFQCQQLVKLDALYDKCAKKKKVRLGKLIFEKRNDIAIILNRIEMMEDGLAEGNPSMLKMKCEQLREYLYDKGFVLNGTQYLPYKRSSAKSRKGEMLFIIKSLHKKMTKWSRMGLDFSKNGKVDYASILAYESLVMSSIIQDDTGMLKIDSKNMLIVSDIDHTFGKEVNVVRKREKNGYLEVVTGVADVTSSIFDGESLLDSRYFESTPKNKMKLLRNHFFKSCAFSCNIENFMKDNCPTNIPFDEWEINDMFGNTIKAKDVHFIFCPSSLKCLKYADVVSNKEKEIDRQSDMYDHWKSFIKSELFGTCKVDKGSKLGEDENGDILQQTTYQFLNSLPLSDKQLDKLLIYEYERIDRLKNDYRYFLDYLEENADDTNANEMFVELYKRNPEFIHTEVFRTYKAKAINAYVERLKRGKVKIPNADYSTICCNPIELLKHSIGQFNIDNEEHVKNIALKENEIYCPMFEDGKELVSWRNPHTSQSNVLISVNRVNEEIGKYMNLSNNIVIINAVGHPIQPILSGSDQDGDTMAICDNETLLEAARECYGKYKVSINDVPSSKNTYEATYRNASIIDNNLSKSTDWIGQVVNENQHVLSLYWHRKATGANKKELDHLIEQIDKFTILSEICIDLAKKATDIDVDAEVSHIKSLVRYEKDKNRNVQFPQFFKMIKGANQKKGQKSKKKLNTEFHHTTMDRLFVKLNELKYANKLENTPFEDFLIKYKKNDANREQVQKIEEITNKKLNAISEIMQGGFDKEERNLKLENNTIYYKKAIRNLEVSEETMYVLLQKVAVQGNGLGVTLLNVLFNHNKETFLNAFKNTKKGDGEFRIVS
ncbi:hypothetical protein OJ967_12225 [Peribacillus frigoritolerans]|uniref:RNA dependent RNA polymerase n=1 Tax=Peribacillus frigoritolerans TaxID=450367 RepID=UPI002226EAB8|nr:hypothetical protein [Peribacillus frigoritolerans]UYZ01189.1 hypothetical protein OJ967_12225 [Peribacillus frigoritolerans]